MGPTKNMLKIRQHPIQKFFLKKAASNFLQKSRLLIRPRRVEIKGCEGEKRNSRAPLLACLVIDTPGEGGTGRNLKEAKTVFFFF